MDAMTQIMTAGPTEASGLVATIASLPASAMAKALKSVTSPASAAAWNSFASTSTTTPGIVTQLQQYNDQMRTGLTLGAITPGQAAGMTGYEIKQALPMAKDSPAALAMLMQQGAQQGIGGYYKTGRVADAELRRAQKRLKARGQHQADERRHNVHDHQAGRHPEAGAAVRAGHAAPDPVAAGRESRPRTRSTSRAASTSRPTPPT